MLTMNVRWFLKRLARRHGYDLVRHDALSAPLVRRLRLLRHHGVDVVLDVGANNGQYARELRRDGYTGWIVSFEPLPDCVVRLRRQAQADGCWDVHPWALGRKPGRAELNVAGNAGQSSSLLPMTELHRRSEPSSAYVDRIAIDVRTLDESYAAYASRFHRPFLKIDTQGFEREVLEGAAATLPSLVGLQLELSLATLYEGAPSLDEMLDWTRERGFALASVEPVFADEVSGRLLQMDGLFFRA